DPLGFDGLHYFSSEFSFSGIVKYCIRPANDKNLTTVIHFFNISDEYFTFNELYHLNVTSYQILLWSSSIDVAVQYQYYLDRPFQSNLSNEIFFKYTPPWFGSRCQYSLEINESNENDYRCHNGLCIPKIFAEIEFAEAQCFDGSDGTIKANCLLRFYYRPHLFDYVW
ncbi:unnamed protein product, partial [Adineta steineri]